jgi:hypothetical protein
VLQYKILSVEDILCLVFQEEVDWESNDKASDKELDVTNKQLIWSSFDSINVNLSISVYIGGSIKGNNVREKVLEPKANHQEVGRVVIYAN